MFEHPCQPYLRIDAVHPDSLDEDISDCGSLSAADGPNAWSFLRLGAMGQVARSRSNTSPLLTRTASSRPSLPP
jgi:hypothetical protein